jgi:hypothetical protein
MLGIWVKASSEKIARNQGSAAVSEDEIMMKSLEDIMESLRTVITSLNILNPGMSEIISQSTGDAQLAAAIQLVTDGGNPLGRVNAMNASSDDDEEEEEDDDSGKDEEVKAEEERVISPTRSAVKKRGAEKAGAEAANSDRRPLIYDAGYIQGIEKARWLKRRTQMNKNLIPANRFSLSNSAWKGSALMHSFEKSKTKTNAANEREELALKEMEQALAEGKENSQ